MINYNLLASFLKVYKFSSIDINIEKGIEHTVEIAFTV